MNIIVTSESSIPYVSNFRSVIEIIFLPRFRSTSVQYHPVVFLAFLI